MSPTRTADEATTEQARAIGLSADTRTLIIAAAGTGKTYTLTRRLEHLLAADISADEVLVLSFSRAAVRELAERARSSAGRSRFVTARTFDSWALNTLEQTYANHDWHQLDFDERIRAATDAIQAGHGRLVTARLRHVLLDEVQDLVGDRLKMVKALLTSLDCGFTLVGDPAQAIYGFQIRPGTSRNETDIFSWALDQFPELVELALTRDFRAQTPRPAGIVACGEALRTASGKVPKDLAKRVRNVFAEIPTAGKLSDIVSGFSHFDGSCAVLCRDNAQALEVSAALLRDEISHHIQHRAGDDINPRWLAALFRQHRGHTLDEPTFAEITGLSGEALATAWKCLLSATRTGSSRLYLSQLRSAIVDGRLQRLAFAARSEAVTVSSMHRAKGLEYDRVFVLDNGGREDADEMEEARLLYMAMTRCRRDLYRLEPLPRTGSTYTKRCPNSGRWGRYRFRNFGHRLGLAVEGGDVSRDLPAGTAGFTADPLELQEYLETSVQRGDPVALVRREHQSDDLAAPAYTIEHKGRPIGLVSQRFRRALERYLSRGSRSNGMPIWPLTITDCWIDNVETVAGSVAAGRRAGLGDHGVWLAPRLTGLTWFKYEPKAESDDE